MGGQTLVIGVLGLGSLGEGIARALLAGGPRAEVVAVDRDPALVRRVGRRLDGEALSLGTELTDLKRADLVIESVSGDPEAKADVLRQLHAVCPPGTVFATVSGSLPVEELAIASGRPERVLGVRVSLPPPHGRNVELVSTAVTSPEALALARQVVDRAGSEVVTLGEGAGEAATELVYGYLNQAVAMVEQDYAPAEDIDTAMRFGCGLPYGPLHLLDLIGLDTVRDTLRTLHARTGNPGLAPAPLLDRMVGDGTVGRKAGAGFYRYGDDGEIVPREQQASTAAPFRDITRIGVVGSGTMARGITEILARAGIETTLVARSEDKASAAFSAVDRSLGRAEQRGRIGEMERIEALGCVNATDDYTELADCDLLIEAVAEELPVKRAVMGRLDTVAKPGAVLASITSSLPVTACAHATSRPGEVIGLHFFNPAPVMKLVEVVRTEDTSADVLATAHALTRQLGKKAVNCTDRTGFIVNALLFPFLNEAILMLDRAEVTVEDIDTAVTTAFGHPMGPFTLLDTVGLDVSLAIMQRLQETAAEEDGLVPAARLEQLVGDGCLGRKTGSGFRAAEPRAAATA